MLNFYRRVRHCRFRVLVAVVIFLFPSTSFAAIARDNTATFAAINGTSATAATITVSSSNPTIVVCDINTKNAVGNVTSFKANGTTMTQVDQNAFIANIGVLYVYVISGVSGTVTIQENQTDGTQGNYGVVSSYTGTKQTGQPDAHTPGTGTSIAGFTSGTTPVASNSWATQCGGNSSTATSPGTGSNSVIAWQAASGMWFYDSNGTVTAGSNYAMQTTGPTANYSYDEITIAPVASAAASFFEGPQWNVQWIL